MAVAFSTSHAGGQPTPETRSAVRRALAASGEAHNPLLALILVALGGTVATGVGAALGVAALMGALGATAVAALVALRPAIGAYMLVGVAPAISGLVRGLPVPGFRISELLIGGISTLIILSARTSRRVAWGAFDWLALAYAVATLALGAIGPLIRHEAVTATALGTLVGPFQFLLLFRAVRVAVRTPKERRLAFMWVLLGSIPVSLLAVAQFVGVGGVRQLINRLTDGAGANPSGLFGYYLQQGVTRATGPFDQPHTLGAYEMGIILLCCALLFAGTRSNRWLIWGALLCGVAGTMTAATATPLIAVIVGVLVLAHRYGRLGRFALLFGTTACIATVAFGPAIGARIHQEYAKPPGSPYPLVVPSSIGYRFSIWTTQFIPAIGQNLSHGYGPDLPPQITWRFTESLYFTLLLRGGIPLLLIYSGLMWVLWRRAGVRARDGGDSNAKALASVLWVIVLLLAPMQLLEPYFVTTGLPHLLWGLIGLMFAVDVGAADRIRSLRAGTRQGPLKLSSALS